MNIKYLYQDRSNWHDAKQIETQIEFCQDYKTKLLSIYADAELSRVSK